jgi:peptidoglycan hydrolase-like protein with peptidoglycan-binding domain
VRRAVAVGVVVVAVGAVAGAFILRRPEDSPSASEPTAPTATAQVERRDLVERESVDGTLGYGDTRDVASPRQGTLTALPAAGATIDRGASLFEVDGRGVPLLFGARPMWRTLNADADDGPDIRQLEENLVALGYASPALAVDDEWDANTTTAVKRWQDALGLDDTGVLAPSDFVFLDGAVRVATLVGHVGDAAGPGSPVIQATGTTQFVNVRLDAAKRNLVEAGAAVQVELPDGSIVDGTVLTVGDVATVDSQNNDSTARVDMQVALVAAAATEGLDATPVDVALTRSAATGVLAVPVRALLALAEGGEALEVVDGARTTLVAVETGVFADGWVEVRGEISEGDDVVVPE